MKAYKKYYGKNYEKAMENFKKKEAEISSEFIKKHPNADSSKFEFDVDLNKDGTVKFTFIYFKNSDVISTKITSSTFLNDKSMTKYLFITQNIIFIPKCGK